jgi:salicylate 5-hydroxylase small subunit
MKMRGQAGKFIVGGRIYHGPNYMRHVICPARIVSHKDGVIRAQAHHAVFRTRRGGVSEVYNVGRYSMKSSKKKTAH